jgi:hypothetical protein
MYAPEPPGAGSENTHAPGAQRRFIQNRRKPSLIDGKHRCQLLRSPMPIGVETPRRFTFVAFDADQAWEGSIKAQVLPPPGRELERWRPVPADPT